MYFDHILEFTRQLK